MHLNGSANVDLKCNRTANDLKANNHTLDMVKTRFNNSHR